MMNNKFEPYQQVLVRDNNSEKWRGSFYSHYDDALGYKYVCTNGSNWKQCIPYKGNEHLLGTSESPKQEERLEFGDKVMVRHYQCQEWKKAIFIEMLVSGKPYNVLTKEEKKIECFGLCKKGWDEG